MAFSRSASLAPGLMRGATSSKALEVMAAASRIFAISPSSFTVLMVSTSRPGLLPSTGRSSRFRSAPLGPTRATGRGFPKR